MGNIYDGAFRTILNDCRKLIIPVINEIFREEYTGEERIEFLPNEHFLDQQDNFPENTLPARLSVWQMFLPSHPIAVQV